MYCPQGLLLLMSILYSSFSAPDPLLLSLKHKQLFGTAWWWAGHGLMSMRWVERVSLCQLGRFPLLGVGGDWRAATLQAVLPGRGVRLGGGHLEIRWHWPVPGSLHPHSLRFQPLMLCCWFYVSVLVRLLLQLRWDCWALKWHGPHMHMCLCSPRHWEALPLPDITQKYHSGLQPCAGLASTLRSGASVYVGSCHVSGPCASLTMFLPDKLPW